MSSLHPVREVNSFLALVCLLRADNMKRRGLIDYNINCFKEALTKVTKVLLGRASEPAGPRRPGSSRGAATRARRGEEVVTATRARRGEQRNGVRDACDGGRSGAVTATRAPAAER